MSEDGGSVSRRLRALERTEDVQVEHDREQARKGLFGDAVEDRPVQMGRFEIESELGRGGMGRVYLATDPKLGRRVALKVLREDGVRVDDSVGRARLLREASAMASLSHPNVVPVFDVGEVGDRIFVAMEFIDGPNLRGWWEERPRSLQAVARRFVEAAHGLGAAHHAGIVHRDFKPENVLVGPDGRTRVTDFGLARAAEQPDELGEGGGRLDTAADVDRLATLTQTGAMVGTPAYMSPEQLAGERVTAASDQYSLCVSLFEALTGRRPFVADTAAALASAVLAGRVVWPGSPKVPRRVRAVVERGLSRHPMARFTDMAELAAALERSVRPQRTRLALGGALALGVGGAVWFQTSGDRDLVASVTGSRVCSAASEETGALWTDSRRRRIAAAFESSTVPHAPQSHVLLERELDTYLRSWAQAWDASCGNPEVTACLRWRATEVDARLQVLVESDSETVDIAVSMVRTLRPVRECTSGRIPIDLPLAPPRGIDPDLHASLREDLARGDALRKAWRFSEAASLLASVRRAAEAAGDHALLPEVELVLGKVARRQGDVPAAEAHFAEAIRLGEREGVRTVAGFAAMERLMLWVDQTRALDTARSQLDASRRVIEASGHPETLSGFLAMAGHMELRAGNVEAAIAVQKEAIEVARAGLGVNSDAEGYAWDYLGGTYAEIGRIEEARHAKRRAIAAVSADRGAEHLDAAVVLGTAGNAHALMGLRDEARVFYERRAAIYEAQYGPSHPRAAQAYVDLAGWWSAEGDFSTAREYADKAARVGSGQRSMAVEVALVRAEIQLWEGRFDGAATTLTEATRGLPDGPSEAAAEIAEVEAAVALARGDASRAREHAARSLELERTAGDDRRREIPPRVRLAQALALGGDLDGAHRELSAAREILEASLGVQPRFRVRLWMAVAQIEQARGNAEAAGKASEKAMEGLPGVFGPAHPERRAFSAAE